MADDTQIVLLEWTFSPPAYFEVKISLSRTDYRMTIADGKVEATIDPAIYDANPGMRAELQAALNARFLAEQLLTHQAYELSASSMTRVHADGRRDIFVELRESALALATMSADIVVTDKDGNVVADSRRERVERKRDFAELVASHRADPLLPALLQSYNASVRDPDNELVHLYEIREALAKRFGDATSTRSALGLSRDQWSRFGRLCDDEPLRQGRHRGKHVGALRDATEGELKEAREIARAMIEAYRQRL